MDYVTTIDKAIQNKEDIPLVEQLIKLDDKSSPSYNKTVNCLLKKGYIYSTSFNNFVYVGDDDYEFRYVVEDPPRSVDINKRASFIKNIKSNSPFSLNYKGVVYFNSDTYNEIKFETGFPICLLIDNMYVTFKTSDCDRKIEIVYLKSPRLEKKIVPERISLYAIYYTFNNGYLSKSEVLINK